MNVPQICDVILRSSATRLQINRRVFKMGRKSKELSEDRKQLVVDLKREGHRNCEIVKLLHLQFVQFGRSTTAQVMLKTFPELDDQGK